MRLLRQLQHWLTGTGRPLRVADFVPESHPVRQWADTLPWTALVAAVDRRVSVSKVGRKSEGWWKSAVRYFKGLEI